MLPPQAVESPSLAVPKAGLEEALRFHGIGGDLGWPSHPNQPGVVPAMGSAQGSAPHHCQAAFCFPNPFPGTSGLLLKPALASTAREEQREDDDDDLK